MKATLFKEIGYSLSKLIEDIDMGEIRKNLEGQASVIR